MEEPGSFCNCQICKIPFGRNKVFLKATLTILTGLALTFITIVFALAVAFTLENPLTVRDVILINFSCY